MSTAAIITCSVFVTAVRAPQAIRLVVKIFTSPAICLAFVAFILPVIPCIASVILATQGLTAYGLLVHVFTLANLTWIDWMYIDKYFAGISQYGWSELPRPTLSRQWLCPIGVVTGHIISGCVVLYLHNPYANLATLLVFSGSYIYLSTRPWPQAFQHKGVAWLRHYQIAFTVVFFMASMALTVVFIMVSITSTVGAILLRKIAVAFSSWLPIGLCLFHPGTIRCISTLITNSETIMCTCKKIRRSKPTQSRLGVETPYGWKDLGGSGESMWRYRGETLPQLLAVLGADKKIGSCVMSRMADGEQHLFFLSIQCSERLGFSSTKEFLSACTNGTIDESRLAESLQNLSSTHIKTADFTTLLNKLRRKHGAALAAVSH